MKIKINENELKNISYLAIKKAIFDTLNESKTVKKNVKDGYLKAVRAGNREANRELNGDGFKQITKVHKSPKDYSRKGRNKNSWKKEIDENSENELTYKTATNARDKAVRNAYDHLMINGSFDNEPYMKSIRQINKFQTYPEDVIKKAIGTKIQAIIEDGIGIHGISFYSGIIKNIKQIKPNVFLFLTELSNMYDDVNSVNSINIIIDFSKSTYNDNESTVNGITDDGFNVDIKFSNKKVRLAIASLINKNGKDEYLKTYR